MPPDILLVPLASRRTAGETVVEQGSLEDTSRLSVFHPPAQSPAMVARSSVSDRVGLLKSLETSLVEAENLKRMLGS